MHGSLNCSPDRTLFEMLKYPQFSVDIKCLDLRPLFFCLHGGREGTDLLFIHCPFEPPTLDNLKVRNPELTLL